MLDILIFNLWKYPLIYNQDWCGLFIIREKITKLAHLIIFPLLLCLTNSILIILKFIFPQLRTLGLENLRDVPVGKYQDIAGLHLTDFK